MDVGHVQGFQSSACGVIFHQEGKATECAICRRAHLIGTDLQVLSRSKCGVTSPNKEPTRAETVLEKQTLE